MSCRFSLTVILFLLYYVIALQMFAARFWHSISNQFIFVAASNSVGVKRPHHQIWLLFCSVLVGCLSSLYLSIYILSTYFFITIFILVSFHFSPNQLFFRWKHFFFRRSTKPIYGGSHTQYISCLIIDTVC